MACHDCLVGEGQVHEFNCDMEKCPFCGWQLISCDCVYEKLSLDCSKGSWTYKHGLTHNQEEQWLEILERKGRVPYIVYPNMCGRCGKLWPDMFSVSDEEWKKYVQIDARRFMLCEPCWEEIKTLIDEGLNEK